ILVLLLTLMLLPGDKPRAGVLLAPICTEPRVLDSSDMLDTDVPGSLLRSKLLDCAGSVGCAVLGLPSTCLEAELLLGDITVILLLDRLGLEDARPILLL